jgi:UDP-glucose 4-epimerase
MSGVLKNKDILITGGCGFIGSNLAENLSENNIIKIMDNLVSGKTANVSGLKNIKVVKADVRDFPAVQNALKGVDLVFHEASNVFVQKSLEEPQYDAENNIIGTINILEACRKNDVKRIVYASSCAVYGDPKELPINEKHPCGPKSPYGASKKAVENYCRLYNELYGIETVSLRYFNVYGPRQDPSSPYSGVISIFIKNILNNKQLFIYGDGNQTRDFVNIKDVVDANILSALSKNAVGKSINIGTGKQTSLNELVGVLKKITNKNVKAIYKSTRPGDIKHSAADISSAKKILEFSPKISLENGLRELLKKS